MRVQLGKVKEKALKIFMSGTKLYVNTGVTKLNKAVNTPDNLRKENENLSILLENLGFESATFVPEGNSMMSGYSRSSVIKPTILRNKELLDLLSSKLKVSVHTFARCWDNNDVKTLAYLFQRKIVSEIHKKNRNDYRGSDCIFNSSSLSDLDIEEYYPLEPLENPTLDDIILQSDQKHAGIIIYGGGANSFLDNIFRGGKDILRSFKRDYDAIHSSIQYVYLRNPYTQFYLCGIQNFLGLNLFEHVNKRFKKLSLMYPNVTYVEPIMVSMRYETTKGVIWDIHPDESEYNALNEHIVKTINDNYVINEMNAVLHLFMRKLSDDIQMEVLTKDKQYNLFMEMFNRLLNRYMSANVPWEKINTGIIKFMYLYIRNYGYDYYFTDKTFVLETLENALSIVRESGYKRVRAN